MDPTILHSRLAFLRDAERLKSVLRSGHTSCGRAESTAEHSWRLSLMAIAFEDELRGLDLFKVLKLCVLHDLGEAIHGDIPATKQHAHPDKAARERQDLLQLTDTLDAPLRASIVGLCDEYERAQSAEALAVKALDKLETILQHNQGRNPPDFDYRFNLEYGRRYTSTHPFFAEVRQVLDSETLARIAQRQ
ncbi:HD domain-containing protein [Mycetohabitans sp. B46]|uniref:HD domain-containing protein n=1 Tax=Mycetohabitans sp. B46 TaxID=2772536 RepID=UPI00307DAC2D